MTDTTNPALPTPPQTVARALRSATLAMIVRALAERPHTYEELVNSVYRGHEPQAAEGCLRVAVYRSDAALQPHGWRIERAGPGRNRRPLRLVPLEARP